MTILITGVAGFIGSHLAEKLAKTNQKIIGIDNLSTGKLQNIKQLLNNPRFTFHKIDLTDMEKTLEATKNVKVAYHLAANPEVRLGEQNPDILYKTNIQATYNLLEVARQNDIETIIYTSSSTVYGDPETIPTPETAPTKPISIYGACKLSCETLLQAYTHTYGIKTLILRLANIIGKRSNHGVIYDFIQKLKRNPHKLEILGDGTQKKSYLHITDTTNAIQHIHKTFQKTGKQTDIYNVGNKDWITVTEIAQIVAQKMNLNPQIHTTGGVNGGRGWKGDVKYMLLDITKAEKTGWKPKLNSKQAVQKATTELITNH